MNLDFRPEAQKPIRPPTTVTIRVGNAVSRIDTQSNTLVEDLDDALRVEFPGADYARRYKPMWDGFWHPVNVVRKTFPTGLLEEVQQQLPMARLVDERIQPTKIEFNEKIIPSLTLADHQKDGVRVALVKGRGIIAAGTGAGKTEMMIAIAMHIPGLCTIIVHKKDLLHQTAERILDRTGEIPSLFGDGRWDDVSERTKFVVAMPQTIAQEPRLFAELVKTTNCLMLDEAHRTSSATWYQVSQMIPAYYRYGCTATPVTDDPVKNLKIVAATGPVIYEMGARELQDIGWNAPCKVIYHLMQNAPMPPGTEYFDARRLLIEENPQRNAEVIFLALEAARAGKPCLVICDTLRHVRVITEILRGEGIRVRRLIGKDSGLSRMQAKKDIKHGVVEVLVSTLFNEGTDLPELEVLVLAAGGKSSVRFIQRVGRLLRKASGKEIAVIHDFFDTGSRHLMRHSAARIRTAQKERFPIEGLGKLLAYQYYLKYDPAAEIV